MKKILCILFLFCGVTTYSQTFYFPVILKQTLRVDGKSTFGGVTFTEDFNITADTIQIDNLDGTGTLLGISGTGKVTRVSGAGAGGVTGLTPTYVLYGSATGTIEQNAAFTFTPSLMTLQTPSYFENGDMTIGSVGGGETVFTPSGQISKTGGVLVTQGALLSGASGGFVSPFTIGSANQLLRVNAGGTDIEWFTPTFGSGTVTSFTFTDGSGFDGTVTNSTTTPTLALTTTVTDNKVMVSNSGAVSGSASLTFDDAVNNEVFTTFIDVLNVNGTAVYGSLFSVNDLGIIGIGDVDGSVNSTYLTINDVTNSFQFYSPNIRFVDFGGAGSTLIYLDNDGDLAKVTPTANDFNFSAPTLSIDYTNGQAASTSTKGFLTDTDWDIFNNKVGLVQAPTDLTAQTASIAATTVYTTPATDGWYRISITGTITTTAGTSLDLAAQLRYTEATDNAVKTFPNTNVNGMNRTQTNTSAGSIALSSVCHVKASTNIQYITTFSFVGGAPQYNLHVTIEKLY